VLTCSISVFIPAITLRSIGKYWAKNSSEQASGDIKCKINRNVWKICIFSSSFRCERNVWKLCQPETSVSFSCHIIFIKLDFLILFFLFTCFYLVSVSVSFSLCGFSCSCHESIFSIRIVCIVFSFLFPHIRWNEFMFTYSKEIYPTNVCLHRLKMKE
jgi:hypothetical protein